MKVWWVTPTLRAYKGPLQGEMSHTQVTLLSLRTTSTSNTMCGYYGNYYGGLGCGATAMEAWAVAMAPATALASAGLGCGYGCGYGYGSRSLCGVAMAVAPRPLYGCGYGLALAMALALATTIEDAHEGSHPLYLISSFWVLNTTYEPC